MCKNLEIIELYCVIPLTCAIPERIRGGLRRCATQIDVYFTFTYFTQLTQVRERMAQNTCVLMTCRVHSGMC